MSQQWDFMGYDRYGQLVVAVNVVNLTGISPEWAADYRKNILSHGLFPNPAFLLFVFPDKLYLWKNVDTRTEIVAPTFTIDAQSFFDPYFENLDLVDGRVDKTTFELIVGDWLLKLFRSEKVSNGNRINHTNQQWLAETGLGDIIKGGRVEFNKELA